VGLAALIAGPVKAQLGCACLRCMTPFFQVYSITAGAMRPTLEPGQCTVARRPSQTEPIRPGTVVYLDHFIDGTRYNFVSRVIATEGQTVGSIAGRLTIDGIAVPTVPAVPYVQRNVAGPLGTLPRCPDGAPPGDTCEIARLSETLGPVTYDVLDLGASVYDDFGPLVVPAGHLFLISDNRDDAVDSRFPPPRGLGFVPIANVHGILDEIR